MALLPDSLKGSLKNVISPEIATEKVLPEKSVTELSSISNNFSNVSEIAKDLKLSRQFVQQLVSIMGGDVKTAGSFAKLVEKEKEIDESFFKEQDKIEAEQEAARIKGKSITPTPVSEEEKDKGPSLVSRMGKKLVDKTKDKIKKSKTYRKAKVAFKRSKFGKTVLKGVKSFTDLKKMFSVGNILKSLGKYLVIGAIITTIFVAFKDSFVEWASSLWESIKESFGEFVENIKQWFKDIVQPIVDKVMEFVQPLIDTISEIFKKIGDFFKDTFGKIVEFMQPAVDFIKRVWDKFMGYIDEFKAWLKPKVEGAMKAPLVGSAVTTLVKSLGIDKFLGIGQPPKEISKEEDDAEKKKLERQQKEAEDTKRVKKQEEEKQYKGDDEIVRKRLGMEEKTMTMRAEERKEAEKVKKEQAAPPAAPPTKPTPAPAAPPAAAKKAEPEVKAPTPSGDDKWIMDMIKKHEGVRTKPYKDSLGLWTVGVGHLIGDGKSLPSEFDREFTMAEIDALFAKDYEKHKKQAEAGPGYDKANEKGRAALIDLAFNMGGAWHKKFKNAAAALASGDFKKASEELTDSQWFKQVKGRAQTIVAMIREGLDEKGGKKPTQVAAADTKPMTAPTPTPSGGTAPAGTGGGSLSSVTKTQSGVDVSGIKSEFEKRLVAMAADFKTKTGKTLLITSGYRSNEKQKELWDKKVAELGGNESAARKWVAEPMPPLGKGKGSFHLNGLAVDINSKGADGLNALAGSATSPTGWLEAFGLTRPVKNEDWHVQPTGLSPTPDNPSNPGSPILVADKSGKPTDVDTGKTETIGPAKTSSDTGTQIASASTDVAAGQREQQKPKTPVVINAPTNNTSVIKKTEVATPDSKDTSVGLVARAA